MSGEKLNAEERLVALLWSTVPGVGPAMWRRLFETCRREQIELLASWRQPAQLACLREKPALLLAQQGVAARFTPHSYVEWLAEQAIEYLLAEDDAYPHLLKQVRHHPFVLYARGQLSLLAHPLPIAVVGTRQMTTYGAQATRALTSDLVQSGALIVSGFMYGVDVAAHRAALDAGGATLAVLGFGFNRFFPRTHEQLHRQLLQSETLFLSPFAPEIEALPGNFPARNQIVAGLSLGVVVVEAARKSGSLITAQSALEEGRVVGAVSGPYYSLYAQGTKSLINQGAILMTEAEDLLQEIRPGLSRAVQARLRPASQANRLLLQDPNLARLHQLIIEHQPTVDELLMLVDTNLATITGWLTELELAELIVRDGQRWLGLSESSL